MGTPKTINILIFFDSGNTYVSIWFKRKKVIKYLEEKIQVYPHILIRNVFLDSFKKLGLNSWSMEVELISILNKRSRGFVIYFNDKFECLNVDYVNETIDYLRSKK